MARFLLIHSYDGTSFHGWQKQAGQRTVQGDLEAALKTFETPDWRITTAGRTDTGVHALAQAAHFDYIGHVEPSRMVKAFNSKLREDIRVIRIIPVADDFHARYDAYERAYMYLLAKEQTPFNRHYTGYIPHFRANPTTIARYTDILIGKYDFSSFGRPNPEVPNRICELKEITIFEGDECVRFVLRADRFLHNMVRRIVGTLVQFGTKDLHPDQLRDILMAADPRQTMVLTAPAQGLYLYGIKYPKFDIDAISLPGFLDQDNER